MKDYDGITNVIYFSDIKLENLVYNKDLRSIECIDYEMVGMNFKLKYNLLFWWRKSYMLRGTSCYNYWRYKKRKLSWYQMIMNSMFTMALCFLVHGNVYIKLIF